MTLTVAEGAPSWRRLLPIILVVDLVIVALTAWSPLVVTAVFGVAFLLFIVRRPAVALAVAAHGMAIFWPLRFTGTTGNDLFLQQVIVALPVAWIVWGALWEVGFRTDSGRGLARYGNVVRRITEDPVVLWTLALWIWLAVRTLGSPGPSYGRSKTIIFLLENVPLTVLAVAAFRGLGFDHQTQQRRHFYRAVLVVVTLISLVALWNLRSEFWGFETRLKALGLNPIWLARYAGVGILVAIAAAGERVVPRTLATALVILFAYVFYSAGSRGPLLALVLSAGFWWTLRGRFRLRFAIASILGLAFLAGFAWIEIQGATDASPFTGHDVSNAVRVMLLKAVWDLGSSPGLVGVGTGGYGVVAGFEDVRLYPHNIFLELWVENGLVGVGLFVGWCVFVARRAAAGVRANLPQVRLAAVVFVFLFVNVQISGDLPANHLLWAWGGILVSWASEAAANGPAHSRSPKNPPQRSLKRPPNPPASA